MKKFRKPDWFGFQGLNEWHAIHARWNNNGRARLLPSWHRIGSTGASPSRSTRYGHLPSSVRFYSRIIVRLCLSVAFLAIFASMALCCSIPVFRYALEHWKPEAFTVHIVSSTPLNDSQMASLKELKELGRTANIRVKVSEGSKSIPDESEAIVQPYRNRDSAWLVVEMGKKVDSASPVAWDGPFTQEAIGRLLTSPLRQKICKGLVDQDSVSWVYLESGDQVVDDATTIICRAARRV